MKQRVYIWKKSIHRVVFILLIFIPQLLSAQEDSTRVIRDSVQLKPMEAFDLIVNPLPERSLHSLNLGLTPTPTQPLRQRDIPDFSFKEELHIPYYTDRSPLFRGDFSTGGILWQHHHGAIFGTGEQETIPGIGRFNEASLGYGHVFNDRFFLQVGVNAMKINRINFVGETFSTSGRLSYRASDRIAFNVFGTYNMGNTFGMSNDSYGATVSVVMSDHFRMEVGAQRAYNTMSGRWEIIPVAIPTYRFDNGAELGIDVGGILHQILRNAVIGTDQRREAPTIAPPRLPMPMR